MKILIAEDDENMCKILKLYLQREGYAVHIASNGEEAINYFDSNHADLVLLDWMMPKKDGLTTCRELRMLNIPVKIIMLTAKAATEDELRGLTTGADDYVRKPFDIKILLARIKKLCNIEDILTYRDISLNPSTYDVKRSGRKVELTKKEFELLKYFLSNINVILTREKILDYVWGIDYDGDVRTVDTHIRRLRKKIGESYIQTRFGLGYMMGDMYE